VERALVRWEGVPVGQNDKVRAIGAKANRLGGMKVMRSVAERAASLSTTPAALRVIDSTWDGIGDWRG
jgi:hypothetical protein